MLYTLAPQKQLSGGYTQAALNYIMALQSQKVNFAVRPLGNGIQWGQAPEWSRSSATYFATTDLDQNINLVHLQPAQLCEAPIWGDATNIALTTFETTKLPSWIVERINDLYDGIIVPSLFNKECLLHSGITLPVLVVEHAIGEWWNTPEPTPEKDDTFVFGYIGAWNNRKNPQGVVEAYLSAFPSPTEKTALMIKTCGDIGYNSLFRHCLKGQDRPDIWYYNEEWSEQQIHWAHSLFDCYVSAHRGEGFGLGLAQAALLGTPVVYTAYSAPCEWLGFTEGHIPISYTETRISGMDSTQNLHFHGESTELVWAEPDQKALVTALKNASENRPNCSLSETKALRKRFSWEKIGADLIKAIHQISPTHRLSLIDE